MENKTITAPSRCEELDKRQKEAIEGLKQASAAIVAGITGRHPVPVKTDSYNA